MEQALGYQAAVAIMGPREVGKTTLALEIGDERGGLSTWTLKAAQTATSWPIRSCFWNGTKTGSSSSDEIHRVPELFQDLRGIIDRERRKGKGAGRFLMLGSASIGLLQQSGETLVGRIGYVDMGPLDILEVPSPKERSSSIPAKSAIRLRSTSKPLASVVWLLCSPGSGPGRGIARS